MIVLKILGVMFLVFAIFVLCLFERIEHSLRNDKKLIEKLKRTVEAFEKREGYIPYIKGNYSRIDLFLLYHGLIPKDVQKKELKGYQFYATKERKNNNLCELVVKLEKIQEMEKIETIRVIDGVLQWDEPMGYSLEVFELSMSEEKQQGVSEWVFVDYLEKLDSISFKDGVIYGIKLHGYGTVSPIIQVTVIYENKLIKEKSITGKNNLKVEWDVSASNAPYDEGVTFEFRKKANTNIVLTIYRAVSEEEAWKVLAENVTVEKE